MLSKVSLSILKQMRGYKSLSFIMGRVPKGLMLSKGVIPTQKVTGLESSGLVLQLMPVASVLRPKKKNELSEIREMNPTGEKQRQWWPLWSREYKLNKQCFLTTHFTFAWCKYGLLPGSLSQSTSRIWEVPPFGQWLNYSIAPMLN